MPHQSLPGTNLSRLAEAIADKDWAGMQQRCFYTEGGGVDRWERLRGGALGLPREVRVAYAFSPTNRSRAMRSSCSGSSGSAMHYHRTPIRFIGVSEPISDLRAVNLVKRRWHRHDKP
jgi:hypothetical protein